MGSMVGCGYEDSYRPRTVSLSIDTPTTVLDYLS